ncbi:MAG: hypothetical protein NTW19_17205 [Planctomycetota bacterium]|nr:hypothetical protein [Planctomycetota bacterium]
MHAGFARLRITPSVGTRLVGYGRRDRVKPSEGVHDDLHLRALWLTRDGEDALILAYDLCFLDRQEIDRLKGLIGRQTDLRPSRILINCTHTHTGPATHTWDYFDRGVETDRLYLRELRQATLNAVEAARGARRPVTLRAGMTRTDLPVSRRRPTPTGGVEWRPYPEGVVCDAVPVCLFEDEQSRVVCALVSASCHPSTISGWLVSADYPGVVCDLVDRHLGQTCTMFLQGCAGDTKARTIADVTDSAGPTWRSGPWEAVERAARMVAEPIIASLVKGLTAVQPRLRTAAVETRWAFQAPAPRASLYTIADDPDADEQSRIWARDRLRLLDRGWPPEAFAEVTLQGIQLGRGLRLIALEGEPVGELGRLILETCGSGVTFPLGYSNGAQLYLPVSRMIDEGGYEIESFAEYGFAAPLAKGVEATLCKGLAELRRGGVE